MIVAICNHKGGTGKTTTAINLGCALALKNKRVLIVDLDPQCNLSYAFGIAEDLPGLSQVFLRGCSLQSIMVKREGTDVVAADSTLADIELSLQQVKRREFVLRELLAPFREAYDYILVDCPPSRSLLTINALCAADKVLVPLFPDVLSIQGLRFLIRTVSEVKQALHSGIEWMGIAIVNVDTRKKLTVEVLDFLEKNAGLKIFKSHVRTSTRITEAPSHGKSIFGYDAGSTGALDYASLADEVLTLTA